MWETIPSTVTPISRTMKPDDFAAIGVFRRDGNQVRQNADLYREWYSEKA